MDLKWMLALMLGIIFTGCQTVAAPQTTQVEKPSTSLHNVIRDVVLYKGYNIIEDDKSSTMVIKYSRTPTWYITYKVQYTPNSYTISYLDSQNLNYKNGKISTTYSKYIGYLQDTINKSLSDPEYYARLQQIVANRHSTQATIAVKPHKAKKKNALSVENYNFFEE